LYVPALTMNVVSSTMGVADQEGAGENSKTETMKANVRNDGREQDGILDFMSHSLRFEPQPDAEAIRK
jgi:hypothetical protein